MRTRNKFRVVGDVVWVSLSLGQETCLDKADWDALKQYRWHAWKTTTPGKFYAQTNMRCPDGSAKTGRMHQMIAGNGVDHRDRSGLNNCRANLRPATHYQQCLNRKRINTSGLKGVSQSGNRWQVEITVDGNRRYLGKFADKSEAAAVYDKAARQFHREFAVLNFP